MKNEDKNIDIPEIEDVLDDEVDFTNAKRFKDSDLAKKLSNNKYVQRIMNVGRIQLIRPLTKLVFLMSFTSIT